MIIDPFYFVISFCIGILLVYLLTPVPKIVIRYPTPENSGKIIYKDDNNVCYKYNAIKIQCPKDKSKINKYPIQHLEHKNRENIFTRILK